MSDKCNSKFLNLPFITQNLPFTTKLEFMLKLIFFVYTLFNKIYLIFVSPIVKKKYQVLGEPTFK